MALQSFAEDADIRRYARGALAAADVGDRLPVPVAEIASTVDLHRDDLYDLADEVPPGMRAILKKLKGRVLGLLSIEERRYYIDTGMPIERQRFTEAHEIGHDALPWHRAAYFGEDNTTLSPDTRASLEAEANLFAAEILFAGDRFNRQADDWAPSIEVPLALAGNFQTSAAATLRRYAWGSNRDLAIIGTGLLRGAAAGLPVFGSLTCESPRFRDKYGPIHELIPRRVTAEIYPNLAMIDPNHRGVVAQCNMRLATKRGTVQFVADGFANGHNGFILLYRKRRIDGQRMRLLGA